MILWRYERHGKAGGAEWDGNGHRQPYLHIDLGGEFHARHEQNLGVLGRRSWLARQTILQHKYMRRGVMRFLMLF